MHKWTWKNHQHDSIDNMFCFGEFSSPVEPLKEKVVEPRQAIEAMVPLNERWGRLSLPRYDEFNVPTVASIAVCQLCRERRVMTV